MKDFILFFYIFFVSLVSCSIECTACLYYIYIYIIIILFQTFRLPAFRQDLTVRQGDRGHPVRVRGPLAAPGLLLDRQQGHHGMPAAGERLRGLPLLELGVRDRHVRRAAHPGAHPEHLRSAPDPLRGASLRHGGVIVHDDVTGRRPRRVALHHHHHDPAVDLLLPHLHQAPRHHRLLHADHRRPR